MRARVKTIICILSMAMVSACLTGCVGEIKRQVPEEGEMYNTDIAMSGSEYALFMTKQISVAENALMTRLSAAMNYNNGRGKSDNELKSTEESISKLNDVIENVTYTKPAKEYDTDRETLLSLLNEARDILKEYKGILENGGGDMTDITGKMEACYIALGGESNAYYE